MDNKACNPNYCWSPAILLPHSRLPGAALGAGGLAHLPLCADSVAATLLGASFLLPVGQHNWQQLLSALDPQDLLRFSQLYLPPPRLF